MKKTYKNLSAISFVRRQLGVKGKSSHNGRGSYECDCNIHPQEVKQKLLAKIPEWQEAGLVESIEDHDESLMVKFNREIFKEDYYRMFVFEFTNMWQTFFETNNFYRGFVCICGSYESKGTSI